MPRTFAILLALAALSASAPLLCAQTAYSAGPGTFSSTSSDAGDPGSGSALTQPPAPIERSEPRSYGNGYADNSYPQQGPLPPQGSYNQQRPVNRTSEPAHGIWLVAAPDASIQTIAVTAERTELRVDHGVANVNVHHPSDHSEIFVDLPGGQVSLLKDGLYTFNADTNTVRVLRGEAEVSINNAKPVKVKEDHELAFGSSGSQVRAQEADRNKMSADLLQGNYGDSSGYRHGDGYGYGQGFYGYSPYAYGWPYYGFYGPGWGYPYYAFGGYPYGYGLGLGFGYYGGFRGGFGYGGYGGFRGGYGGFRGGFRR